MGELDVQGTDAGVVPEVPVLAPVGNEDLTAMMPPMGLPPGPSKKTFLIVAAALVAVALIGGALFVATQRNDTPVSPTTTKNDMPEQSRQDTPTSTVDDKANDAERKADLQLLQGQIEAHYAMTGEYPTFAQINDEAFRANNMKGLDPQSLRDPEADEDTSGLSATPEAGVYAYKASPTGCDNTETACTGYTLLAFLSTGDTYTLTALN